MKFMRLSLLLIIALNFQVHAASLPAAQNKEHEELKGVITEIKSSESLRAAAENLEKKWAALQDSSSSPKKLRLFLDDIAQAELIGATHASIVWPEQAELAACVHLMKMNVLRSLVVHIEQNVTHELVKFLEELYALFDACKLELPLGTFAAVKQHHFPFPVD